MTHTDPTPAVDSRLARAFGKVAERQLQRARAAHQLQELLTAFPELLDDLLAANRETSEAVQPALFGEIGGTKVFLGSEVPERRKTAFERVVDLFLENGNDWINTADLSTRAGMSRNVLATVLWSTRRTDFEQRPHPTHSRMKLWRLKPETYNGAKGGER